MKNAPTSARLGGATPALRRLPSSSTPHNPVKDGSPLPITQGLRIPAVSQMQSKNREQPPQAPLWPGNTVSKAMFFREKSVF